MKHLFILLLVLPISLKAQQCEIKGVVTYKAGYAGRSLPDVGSTVSAYEWSESDTALYNDLMQFSVTQVQFNGYVSYLAYYNKKKARKKAIEGGSPYIATDPDSFYAEKTRLLTRYNAYKRQHQPSTAIINGTGNYTLAIKPGARYMVLINSSAGGGSESYLGQWDVSYSECNGGMVKDVNAEFYTR